MAEHPGEEVAALAVRVTVLGTITKRCPMCMTFGGKTAKKTNATLWIQLMGHHLEEMEVGQVVLYMCPGETLLMAFQVFVCMPQHLPSYPLYSFNVKEVYWTGLLNVYE